MHSAQLSFQKLTGVSESPQQYAAGDWKPPLELPNSVSAYLK